MEEAAFAGTDRYELRRVLGRGGFGTVYEAHDRRTGCVVALKWLRHLQPKALLRFKNEFRALVGFAHPNVVALYELDADGERCFFTMELVRGGPLLEFVGIRSTPRPSAGTTVDLAEGETPAPAPERSAVAADPSRVRATLGPLAAALHAVHEAGLLHRDVKPSNVLVTPAGRTVLLDFGLVTATGDPGDGRLGTPAYVAPEQARGAAVLGPAADWYAFGTVLFEALTGQLPFAGAGRHAVWRKQQEPAPDAREVSAGVPDDLADLAARLLSWDPATRPSGRDVLAAFGLRPRGGRAPPFVGREDELARLARACAAGGVVRVEGPSGIGKTALVRRSLADFERRAGATVLASRCREHESIRYKAIDPIVDALAPRLAGLPPVRALRRLFPALGETEDGPADGREVRRQAATELREALAALARRGPVALWIDDAQWADADSVDLLADVLRPPDAPPIALVATRRSDLPAPELDRLAAAATLALGPLPETDALALARAIAPDEEQARAAVEAAGGAPFALEGLARGASGRSWLALPPEEGLLLEAVVIALRPIPRRVAAAAAGLGTEDQAAISGLRAARLVRAAGVPGDEVLEPWHDQVREAVGRDLDAAARPALHAALADAWRAAGVDDPEILLPHEVAAGRTEEAVALALRAGDAAADAFAFHLAAERFDLAIRLGADDADVHRRHGDALVQSGHVAAGAEALLRAVDRTHPDAPELMRRAAEHLLVVGHTARAFAVLDRLLGRIGLSLPRSRGAALLRFAGERARIAWRGQDWRPAIADPAAAFAIDVCWSIGSGLAITDVLCAQGFQARAFRLALDAGDPARIARARSMEAGYLAAGSPRAWPRARALVDEAKALLDRVDDPLVHGVVELNDGVVQALSGRWTAADVAIQAADARFRARNRELYWGRNSVVFFGCDTLVRRGMLGELARRVEGYLPEARATGNLHLLGYRAVGGALGQIAHDRPDLGWAAWQETPAHGPELGYLLTDWWRDLGALVLFQYEGRAEEAWRRLRGVDRALLASGLSSLWIMRQMRDLAGAHAAISLRATATSGFGRAGWGWRARRRIAGLAGAPWADAQALLHRAGLAAAEGRRDDARTLVALAWPALAGTEQALWAAAAGWRWGELTGGDAGRDAIASAREALLALGFRSPERAVAFAAAPSRW